MKKIFPVILSIFFMLNFINVYATENEIDIDKNQQEIEQKIEKQNEDITEKLNTIGLPNNKDKILRFYNTLQETKTSSLEADNLQSVKKNLFNTVLDLSIKMRKYPIPIYISLLILNAIFAITIGSKSMEKRKHYILYSISLTILFVLFLNIPVLMIYFSNNTLTGQEQLETTYTGLYAFINFAKRNSLTICVIFIIYGILLKILGSGDVAKKMAGHFFIKGSIVTFILIQLLPIVVNFIL